MNVQQLTDMVKHTRIYSGSAVYLILYLSYSFSCVIRSLIVISGAKVVFLFLTSKETCSEFGTLS